MRACTSLTLSLSDAQALCDSSITATKGNKESGLRSHNRSRMLATEIQNIGKSTTTCRLLPMNAILKRERGSKQRGGLIIRRVSFLKQVLGCFLILAQRGSALRPVHRGDSTHILLISNRLYLRCLGGPLLSALPAQRPRLLLGER